MDKMYRILNLKAINMYNCRLFCLFVCLVYTTKINLYYIINTDVLAQTLFSLVRNNFHKYKFELVALNGHNSISILCPFIFSFTRLFLLTLADS